MRTKENEGIFSMTSTMMNKYECFDGAINFESDLNLIDASKFRQVPDNQEVFIGKDSEVSVIVEVLEHVKEAKTDEEAAKLVSSYIIYCLY